MVAAAPGGCLQNARVHVQRPLRRLAEGKKKGWASLLPGSSVRWLGTLVELSLSAGGQRNVGSALVVGSYEGLEPGASPTRTTSFPLMYFT